MAARRGFRRTRHGIEIRLDRAEAALLRQLTAELLALLVEDDVAAPADPLEALVGMTLEEARPPSDPVLARLLPDAYRDDPDAAGDFRRYTEPELRATKRAALRRITADVAAEGGRVTLDENGGNTWLAALNDLRLALGTRLDVTEDIYAEADRLDPHDPRLASLAVYEWLGLLEETLVRALAGR
jgi:hypothetical protein